MSGSNEFRAALINVPDDIVAALEREFADLEARYVRGDWGPAELDGGRLAEALFRYLDWKQSGTFTPIGNQLNRSSITQAVKTDTSLPEGVRFHVRRCTDLLMDIRNKRDVAHLGSAVNVNEMDSQLVMRLASWSLAEIVREEGNLSPEEAQHLIDRFSAIHVPLVEEIDGDLIVVATELRAATRALVALYHAYPDALELEDLREAVRYQHKYRFRNELIADHQSNGLVHVKDDRVFLTHKGAVWVEANVDFELRVT